MKLHFYLVVTEHGAISTRKNRPDTRIGEIVIPMRLNVPDTVFRPKLLNPIEIEVPEAHVIQPTVETVEEAIE